MTARPYAGPVPAAPPDAASPLAAAPRTVRRRVGAFLRANPWWSKAWAVVIVLTTLLVIRLGDFWPILAKIRPSILGGLWAIFMLASHTKPAAIRAMFRERVVRWMLVYLGAIALAIPFALWRGAAASLLRSLPLAFVLVCAVMLCAPDRRVLDKVLNWTVLSASVMAVLVGTLGAISADALGGDRLGTGSMYDPNDLAAVVCAMMWLAIGMAMRTRGRWRMIAIGGALAMLGVVLRTGSRGGVVALVVAIPVMLSALDVRRFVPFVLALSIAIPVGWTYGPETFRVRARSLLHIEDDYTFQANEGRIQVWKRGLGYALERPVVGVGPGSYAVREGQYYADHRIPGAWLTAHNTYVQVLVELGLVGTVPFLVLIVGAVRDAARSWRPPPASNRARLYRPEIFVALISFMTSAIFLSHAYTNILFFMIALCAFARRVDVAERAERAGRPAGGRASAAPGARSSRFARPLPAEATG